MRAAYIIFADNPDNQVAVDERLHRGRSLDGVVSEVMGTGRLRSRKVIGMWVVDAEGATEPDGVVRVMGRVPAEVLAQYKEYLRNVGW